MIFAYAPVSKASRYNGNELLNQCKKAEYGMETSTYNANEPEGIRCIGFVNGIYSTMQVAAIDPKFLNACFPESGLSTQQAIRIVTKYLNDHPEKLHEPDCILSIMALKDAFPCENN